MVKAVIIINDHRELVVDLSEVYEQQEVKNIKRLMIRWRLDVPTTHKHPVLNLESVKPKREEPIFSKELTRGNQDQARLIVACMSLHGYMIIQYQGKQMKAKERPHLLLELKKRVWEYDPKVVS